MKQVFSLILTCLLLSFLTGTAQRVTYTEPDREDARTLNFEVIGKIDGKVLVYKNYRDFNFIVSYDDDMKMVDRKSVV